MFQKYRDYINNNPQGYWFKRKLYGWGWVPVRWQGWLVVSVWLVAVIAFARTIDENSPDREVFFTFILPVLVLTVLLIRISYKKGEKPKWQWGLPKEDNEDHD